MTASILVATPHPPFGELLRISLEDSGQYQVRLVQSAKEARAAAGRVSFPLAILDSSLSDEPFTALCADLLRQQPGLRLVVIPPENNPNHQSLGGLLPHGYLSRPFYLPDLIATVSRLLKEREREMQPGSGQARQDEFSQALPAWLQEPLTLTAYLKNEMIGTAALAGIVGMNDPALRNGTLRAYAGDLTDAAAEEMVGAVFRYWDRGEKTDLMRYLRLTTNKKDYLVYAAQITGNLALILAYDTGAPLSQIRPQTRHVAHIMATTPPEGFAGSETGQEKAQTKQAEIPVSVLRPAEPKTEPYRPVSPDAAPPDHISDLEDEEAGPEGELINLTSLLGAIPSPDPDKPERNGNGWQVERPASKQSPTLPEWMNGWETITEVEDDEKAPGPPSEDDTHILSGREKVDSHSGPTEKVEVAASKPAEYIPPAAMKESKAQEASKPPDAKAEPARSVQRSDFGFTEPPPETLEDTRPGVISTINQLTQLETQPPSLSMLNYTCVLVPRMPGHYLTGELADRLSQWVAQLCLAFGWRLEGIAVRPEYLQWSVQVAPAVSPGNVVRILRQRTSQNIFQSYAGLADDNPSGDFWASGYLIVSGPQPPSAQLLRDYILRTRKRQGLAR